MSRGTATPGGAALAVLLPVKRGTAPMTLSVGGSIAEIYRDKVFCFAY